MIPKLTFILNMDYLITEYKGLRELAIDVIKVGSGKALWIFNVNDIEKVIKLTGKPIEFKKMDIEAIEPYSPITTKTVKEASRTKGKGYYKVIFRAPKLFICETIINGKKVVRKVPTENIKVLWDVMKKYPMNKEIQTHTVAEKIIEELEIDRFNRKTGTFDFAKFFGERKDYHRYFYGPAKILESEGVIIHHKYGAIERKADNWELQLEI